MERWQREHILKNQVELIKNTTCHPYLITKLRSLQLLSQADVEELERPCSTPFERSKKLYEILPSRVGSFQPLIECLKELNQSGAVKILEQYKTIFQSFDLISIDKNCVLGYGRSGTKVYKGQFDGREVAVKVLHSFMIKPEKALQEVEILKKLDKHDNIIRYYMAECYQDFIFIALELCKINLEDEILTNLLRLESKLILKKCTKGLAFLHDQQIIHRDIKPANIMLTGSGQVKITDFGLSKQLQTGASHASVSGVVGTVDWIAPEVLSFSRGMASKSAPKMTQKSDIFSMGCVFFFVLSKGFHPFGDEWERQHNIIHGKSQARMSAIEEEWRQVVSEMIHYLPGKRPTAKTILEFNAFKSRAAQRLTDDVPKMNYCAAESNINSFLADPVHNIPKPKPGTRKPSKNKDEKHGTKDVEILKPEQLSAAKLRTHSDKSLATNEYSKTATESISLPNIRPSERSQVQHTISSSKAPVASAKPVVRSDSSQKTPRVPKMLVSSTLAPERVPELATKPMLDPDIPKHDTKAFFNVVGKHLDISPIKNIGNENILPESPISPNLKSESGFLNRGTMSRPNKLLEIFLHKEATSSVRVTSNFDKLIATLDSEDNWIDQLRRTKNKNLNLLVSDIQNSTIAHHVCMYAKEKHFQKFLAVLGELGESKIFNHKNMTGNTPIHLAFQYQQIFLSTAKFLLRIPGFNINEPNNIGNSVILLASVSQSKEVIEKIVELGGNWKQTNKLGETVLHLAVEGGNMQTLEYYLQLGADADEKTSMGYSPLHYSTLAPNSQFLGIVKLLLEYGADIRMVTKDGEDLLFLAAQAGKNPNDLQCLVNYGCSIRHTNLKNQSILHAVVQGKNLESIQFVLSFGICIQDIDNENLFLKCVSELEHTGYVDAVKYVTEMEFVANSNKHVGKNKSENFRSEVPKSLGMDFRQIEQCFKTSLTHLNISNCGVLENCNFLEKCRLLKHLVLYNVRIRVDLENQVQQLDGFIDSICQLKDLEHLDISVSKYMTILHSETEEEEEVEEDGVEFIAVYSTPDNALKKIAQSLRKLTHLDISGTNLAEKAKSSLSGRKNCPLEYLGLYPDTRMISDRYNIPAKVIGGRCNLEELIAACEFNIYKPELLQIIMYDLYKTLNHQNGNHIATIVTGQSPNESPNQSEYPMKEEKLVNAQSTAELQAIQNSTENKNNIVNIANKTISAILRVMNVYCQYDEIQVRSTAILVNAVKMVNRNDADIDVLLKRRLVGACTRTLEVYSWHCQIFVNSSICLEQLELPGDVLYMLPKFVGALERQLVPAFETEDDHLKLIQVTCLLASSVGNGIYLRPTTLVHQSSLVQGVMKLLLSALELKEITEVAKNAWAILSNLTDERPSNCETFVLLRGAKLFLEWHQAFPKDNELLTGMFVTLSNVFQVASLRERLWTSDVIVALAKLESSSFSTITIPYLIAEIFANVLSDGISGWNESALRREIIVHNLERDICNWKTSTRIDIRINSFSPLMRLLSIMHTPVCQKFAVWAIASFIGRLPDEYVPMLQMELSSNTLETYIEPHLGFKNCRLHEEIRKLVRQVDKHITDYQATKSAP